MKLVSAFVTVKLTEEKIFDYTDSEPIKTACDIFSCSKTTREMKATIPNPTISRSRPPREVWVKIVSYILSRYHIGNNSNGFVNVCFTFDFIRCE